MYTLISQVMLSFHWTNTKLKLFSPRCYLGPELMRVLFAQCEVVCQDGTGGAAIPRFAMPVWKEGEGRQSPSRPLLRKPPAPQRLWPVERVKGKRT